LELLRVLGNVVQPTTVESEIQHLRSFRRVRDPIGYLALDRNFLEVLRRLLENEVCLATAQRNRDDRGGRREIPESEARTFFRNFPSFVNDDKLGGIEFDVAESKHDRTRKLEEVC